MKTKLALLVLSLLALSGCNETTPAAMEEISLPDGATERVYSGNGNKYLSEVLAPISE